MSKNWYLMGVNTYFSGFEKDEVDYYAIDAFDELLYVSPEAEDMIIDGQQIRGIVQKTLADTETSAQYRNLLTQIGISRCGAYVELRDKIWLIVTEPDHNTMYEKSIMHRCNKVLKWINKDNVLIEKPAITTSQTLYTTGVKEEKILQVPDGKTAILLPYDDDTKELNRGMSFIFNRTKYTITHYNEADRPGLLSLICDESIPNEKHDDLINEIADRWDEQGNDRLADKPSEPVDGEITIIITGSDRILITSKATYTATVYNNGAEVDEPVYFTISDTSLAKIESQGDNQCVVKANDDFKFGRFNLTATLVVDESIYVEKEIRITGL